MNNYLLLIASIIAGCSLIALLLMYLHYRRVKQNFNMIIVKHLREQNRLLKELVRIRMEKGD